MKNILILFLLIVSLSGRAQTSTIELPQEVKNALQIKDDGKPLEITPFEEGDAVVKVHFLGYRPDMNYDKVQLFVNNPITGIQEEHSFNVSEDGYAEAKISLVHTMGVLFRTPFYNDYVMFSPNKETSVYIDLQQMETEKNKKYFETQYMFFTGANAEINNQMNQPDVNQFYQRYRDYNKLMEDIVGMTMTQYKDYRLEKTANTIARIPELNLTRKAADYLKLSLEYDNMYHLMFADSDLEGAYRRANNNESTGFARSQADEDFYLFLKNSPINNPISLYSEGFGNMVNSSKYIGNRNKIRFANTVSEYILQSIEKTENITDEDKIAIDYIRREMFDNWSEERKSLMKDNMRKVLDKMIATGKLTQDQREKAEEIIKKSKSENISMKTLIELNASLTIDLLYREKVFTREEYEGLEDKEIQNAIWQTDSTMLTKANLFLEKYKDGIAKLEKKEEQIEQRSYLSNYIGADRGILFELIRTQTMCRKFEEYEPLTSDELDELSALENPFYKQYLIKKNNELIAKIEENKSKGGYRVYEIQEEVTGDAILQGIVKPFEGKVVFIDFWATWCGPCRSAMKQFEPAKKSFEGKNVVFIYVTNESSPLNTWTNMIPNMAGEHIRIKDEQFKYLREKYGITGIPSYMILNKKGEQVYFKVAFEGSGRLAGILNAELEK